MTESGQRQNDSTGGALSTAEAVEVASHIADIARSSLPMAPGLRAVAREIGRGRVARALRRVAERMEQGDPLDRAIDAAGSAFPPHLRGLIVAGTDGGRLIDILDQYVSLDRSRGELQRRLWAVLAYPILLLTFLSYVFTFFNAIIVPQFEEIFRDWGVQLPAITQFILWMSHSGAWGLFGGVGTVAVLVLAAGLVPWNYWPRRAFALVPVLGPLWRARRMVEFSRWMSMLLEQSVPLPVALRWTGEGLHSAELNTACRLAAANVEGGQKLSASLIATAAFPPTLRPLVEWGERMPNLPAAFQSAAEMYEGRIDIQYGLLHAVALPLVMMFVGGWAAMMILGLTLPLISLIQNLT
jgi:general secretion pathway protein F